MLNKHFIFHSPALYLCIALPLANYSYENEKYDVGVPYMRRFLYNIMLFEKRGKSTSNANLYTASCCSNFCERN